MSRPYGTGLYGVGLYSSPAPALTDWQAEFRGLTVGDGTLYDFVTISGLDDIPPLRTSDQPLQRRHGANPADDFLDIRSVILEFDILAPADTVTATLAAFNDAFTIGPEAEFVFQVPGVANGGVCSIFAKTRKRTTPRDLTYLYGLPRVTVQLDCTDPRIYSASAFTDVAALPARAPGRSWPQSWPMSYGGQDTGGRATVPNDGNFPVDVFTRIDGPVVNPRISNVTTGTGQQLDIDLAAGDWLEIDASARTVLLNGTQNRYSALTRGSQWISLDPGANDITFDAFAGGSAARMSMTWRSAWI